MASSSPYTGPPTEHLTLGVLDLSHDWGNRGPRTRDERLQEYEHFAVDPPLVGSVATIQLNYELRRHDPSAEPDYQNAGSQEIFSSLRVQSGKLNGNLSISEFEGHGAYCKVQLRITAKRG